MALLERTTEVQALVGAVAAATNGGSGGVVLVEGPAGIGKTALVDAAGEAAAAAGLLVLRARGGELEHEFAFGVVRQLFEPALNGAAPTDAALAGHARHAALALGLTASGGPPTGDPSAVFAALHGLYWLTANLAAARPLALLVDDAHWADSASMRFLAYLARRVEGLPVLVVVATRPRPEGDAVHAALAADAVPTLLTPRPLSREAVAEIVRALTPAADDEVCAACHAATGGNAFYARELARAIAERGLAPGAAERLRASSPERVTRVVGARLARLPADARALAH
ncbi:MAG: transcriptional regulator, LuxR family, partial [Conexibacter sp.]|nr:transcriptional regulator, LuxR family [Conexibacter sp.]